MSAWAKVAFVCETCGVQFLVPPSRAKQNPRFCSTACWANRIITQETREKQSIAKKGKRPWNYGVAMWETREHPRGTLGMTLVKPKSTEETKRKLSLSHRGLKYPAHTKEKHWNWRGGITPENKAARASGPYKEWRRKVFERDNFTCVFCGKRGGELHADHIVPFSARPDLRIELSNGRTLCVECHRKTPTYGGKMLSYEI